MTVKKIGWINGWNSSDLKRLVSPLRWLALFPSVSESFIGSFCVWFIDCIGQFPSLWLQRVYWYSRDISNSGAEWWIPFFLIKSSWLYASKVFEGEVKSSTELIVPAVSGNSVKNWVSFRIPRAQRNFSFQTAQIEFFKMITLRYKGYTWDVRICQCTRWLYQHTYKEDPSKIQIQKQSLKWKLQDTSKLSPSGPIALQTASLVWLQPTRNFRSCLG